MTIKPFFVTFFILAVIIANLSLAIRADGGEGEEGEGGFWWYIHPGKQGSRCNSHKGCWEKITGLTCCKQKCVDLKEDRANCGSCESVCGYNTECCNGKCVNVMSNSYHCGGCSKKCPNNVKCDKGMCGYAS